MTDQAFENPVTSKIVDFVRSIGLPVVRAELDDTAFMPGLALDGGRIVIDEDRLLYPGDILHEAGHLAVLRPEQRAQTHGRLGAEGGEEMGAIAWSYAAAVHIQLDPVVLFHPDGYRGGANALLENFAQQRYIGVPYLQWLGLTLEPPRATQQGVQPYPHMLRWLCEAAVADAVTP
jgi:hypothetical protein